MATNKNTCQCPQPPGGVAICESHQLAICRVKEGVVQTECLDPPSDLAGVSFQNWALRKITGTRRSALRMLSQEDINVLANGEYHDPATGMTVTFRLPRNR